MSVLDTPERSEATLEARPSGSELLVVEELAVSYGGAAGALRDVGLRVDEGAVVAVLGNNGAGKSTLLRAISGTLPLFGGSIEHGSVRLGGQELRGRDPAEIVRSGVVQVPEGRRIFGGLTVEENLRAAALAVKDRTARGDAMEGVFDLFPRLADRRSQPGALLSGGEQQMLAIGRALMTEPQLLLLDEPSLGLAPHVVGLIADVIREINQRGTAVLLVEQNAAIALELAHYAIVLEVGSVALEGAAQEVAKRGELRERYLGVASVRRAVAPPRLTDEAAPSAPAVSPVAEREALRVEDVTVRFGGVSALSEVSLTIEPGTIHALIGPNGAGKSTCLNVLTGVYSPNDGHVYLGGVDLTKKTSREIARLGISRTFQNLSLSPTATVAENLLLGRHRLTRAGFGATALALPWARREQRLQLERVRDVAALVGLGDQLDTPAGALPYGDRKRVELARALCAEPTLLLLDEPVAGMNAAESADMALVVTEIQRELGLTILLVEHDMTFVMGLASRVTVLDFGRCISEGTPEEVQRDPEVVRAYLGSTEDSALARAMTERATEDLS